MNPRIILPIISCFATVILTLIATYYVKLDKQGAFIIFATGTSITLGITLIEQKIYSELSSIKEWTVKELKKIHELYKTIEEIDDEMLKGEVFSLAKSLCSGEVPAHITTVRVPSLYLNAKKSIYASNMSLKKEDLLRWSSNARFKQILETSRIKYQEGLILTRTFILSRSEVIKEGGAWDDQCKEILQTQVDAGIEIRVIWIEDLHSDNILPIQRIDRNFTIFDDTEAIDATNSQVIFRLPSRRVYDFIKMQQEQLKYSHKFYDIFGSNKDTGSKKGKVRIRCNLLTRKLK